MTDAELEVLVADLESDRVERKESIRQKDKIAQAICAFANDLPGHRLPGVLVVGLRDDATPANLTIDDQLLLDLGAIRSDGKVLPLPTMSVQRRTLRGTDVAVVLVEPASDPPVRYDGRVWVCVGPRRAIASRDEERILTERRRSRDLPYDHQPVRDATLADLDVDAIRRDYLPRAVDPETLAENHRPIEHQLASLQLATADGVPTVAATILFGRAPRASVPGAYVVFVRFNGVDVTDPILDQKELQGPIPELLRRLDDVLVANIRIATEVHDHHVEIQKPDYALAALQQLSRNAVMHRNYETSFAPVRIFWFRDRVEIDSPGGPFGRVTAENFGSGGVTDYRNPSVAAGMRVLGYVQRFGMGIPLARRACQEIGAAPPEYVITGASVRVIVRARYNRAWLDVDTRGDAHWPDPPATGLVVRVPRHAGVLIDARLRASPTDVAAWTDVLAEVEGAVRSILPSAPAVLVVRMQGPYPLAAWLGRCLDHEARNVRIELRQAIPGTGRELTFDPQATNAEPPYYEPANPQPGCPGGVGWLLVLEGATAIPDTRVTALLSEVAAAEVIRLRPLVPAPLDNPGRATAAARDLRAIVAAARRRHPDQPVHVLTAAPASLLVEFGRQVGSAASPVIVHAHSRADDAVRPVLDIAAGAVVSS